MLRYALPCWVAGVVLSFALPSVPHWAGWAAAFLCAVAAAWKFRPAAGLLFLLAGAAYGVWRTEAALQRQWPLDGGGTAQLVVEVADMPRRDGRRVQFTGNAQDGRGGRFTLLLSDYRLRDWPVGSRWRVSARVRPVVGEVNLRGLNREAWALSNGIGGIGSVGRERMQLEAGGGGIAVWRAAVSRRWQGVQTGGHDFSDGLGLMRALSIGEQSALRPELWQAFRPLGLTHLVSISGLHVTMVAVLFGWLVRLSLRRLPLVPSRPRLWVLAGGLAGALLYAVLAGFSVPTQRSVLMLAVFAWAWWRGSGASGWDGWWQALAAVLLFDPSAVLGVGTWLSFGLVAALVWVSAGRLNARGRMAAVRGQWAASLLSVVLLGYLFASLPLASPLVNALAIPWFSWVLTPLALLGSVLPFAPLQWTAAALAEYTLRLLVFLAGHAPEAAVAAAPLPLAVLAAVAALLALLPRGTGLRPFAWLVLAGFAFYRPAAVAEGRLKAVVMDAGQGLSVLMRTKEHDLLFDTGTAQAAAAGIVPSLNALGVRRLDRLILSHHDNDHDGGFQAVADGRTVARITAGQPEFYPQAEPCRETQWQWDGVRFELLRPSENAQGLEDNDRSCVLRVVAGGDALLVTGDLGRRGEAELVGKYGGALYSQVLVLGHHGSDTASSGLFLHAVSPQYAVASSGYANAYKHPSAAVQARVKAHGITLLRTDLSGALLFELGGGNVYRGRLKTWKPYWQKKPFDG